MMTKSTATRALTVSQLNKQSKDLLEKHFGFVWLTGEVSNFVQPRSGHWYFTLKDTSAQIRAAMFKGKNQLVNTMPKDGDEVLVRAKLSLFEPRGDYQLIVEYMEPSGFGQLQQAFEALKVRLGNEGLFDTNRKRPLPKFVHRLGIVTSSTGAAIQDVLQIINRRYPLLEVVIFPCLVQGKDAPTSISKMITVAAESQCCDVLLLTRGGGSMEDLWAFNDEQVARHIARCPLPVVSAIGHETDFTIADFVADLRAPTPSAAAELLTPDRQDLLLSIETKTRQMQALLQQTLDRKSQLLDLLASRIKHPLSVLDEYRQKLSQSHQYMSTMIQHKLAISHHQTGRLQTRLAAANPEGKLTISTYALEQAKQRLLTALQKKLDPRQKQLTVLCAKLDALSPLKTLNRGFSISQVDGSTIQTVDEALVGKTLKTTLSGGVIISQIDSAKPSS